MFIYATTLAREIRTSSRFAAANIVKKMALATPTVISFCKCAQAG